MAAKYLSNPNNPFFSVEEDDVDDETFLKNAPARVTPTEHYQNFDNNITTKRQEFLQRKKEIEESTIKSSERSVSLLRDSEQIGVATAEELVRQREQLQKTEKRLDDINSTLRFSQKHIQGIKSVFGSLKNYLGGKSSSMKLSESSSSGSVPSLSNTLKVQSDTNEPYTSMRIKEEKYDNDLQDTRSANDRVTKVLEENLNEMSGSLARLKHLAIGLSEEIDFQNDLIDNITDKTDKADVAMRQQTKDMSHLLRK